MSTLRGLEASLEARVKLGAVTLNELRDSLGLDPYANAAADRPMVLTPTGYVPIEANSGGQGANAGGQSAPVVQKYDPAQPWLPAGNPDGGQWTSENGVASSDGSQVLPDATPENSWTPGAQYAQDFSPGSPASMPGQQGSSPPGKISASDIPADNPMHPVPFVDSNGNPITDDQGNPLLRPANLPPEMFVVEGNALNLTETQQTGGNVDEVAEALLLGIARFRHNEAWDAERFEGDYVSEYHDYASIAIGLYMAAAGISLDDALTIVDRYAAEKSSFDEPMDDTYTHTSERDVRSIKRGYDLYESGRILPGR